MIASAPRPVSNRGPLQPANLWNLQMISFSHNSSPPPLSAITFRFARYVFAIKNVEVDFSNRDELFCVKCDGLARVRETRQTLFVLMHTKFCRIKAERAAGEKRASESMRGDNRSKLMIYSLLRQDKYYMKRVGEKINECAY